MLVDGYVQLVIHAVWHTIDAGRPNSCDLDVIRARLGNLVLEAPIEEQRAAPVREPREVGSSRELVRQLGLLGI